jgi:K+-transporting ATPase ATPase C chain
MKQHILPALKLTFISLVIFCGGYTLLIWGIAQFVPGQGLGETISANGRKIGYLLEGQNFNKAKYFWGRPSAVGYNAAGSGGSNKGPSNPDYLKDLQGRIDDFLRQNPDIRKDALPSDLVTASGSGLDPDISLQAAFVQIPRIARIRNIGLERLRALVEAHRKTPLLGLFGTERVNVLELNLELDQSTKP